MGIPIINELWNGILTAFRWVSDHTPPFLKFTVIFLFIISFLGFVLPFAFGIFGYHCGQVVDPVDGHRPVLKKMSFLDFFDNYKIYSKDPKELNSTDLLLGSYLFGISISDCRFENESDNYFKDIRDCNNCTGNKVWSGGIFGQWYCDSDVSYVPLASYGTYDKLDCEGDPCRIPDYYYYNQTADKVLCLEHEFCGNLTGIELVNRILADNNALPVIQNPDDESATGLIGLSCNDEYKPVLVVFGIEIFNYMLWVFLFILIALIKVWSYFRN